MELLGKQVLGGNMSDKSPLLPKLSQRDIAGILKIDTKTLYNWRKNKSELYTIVMLGFKFREILEAQQQYTQTLEKIQHDVLVDSRLKSTPPPPAHTAHKPTQSKNPSKR